MKELLLKDFKQIISQQMGLRIRDDDNGKLKKSIFSRMKILKISDAEAYYRLLLFDTSDQNLEWRKLATLLTTAETFFFRDKGQFKLLRDRIMPELIESRKNERKLRIWSAGCSTGEEPYSLAILLDELLPQQTGWDILILGTDINKEAIDKAKQGVYSEWSFRMVELGIRERYFRKKRNGWNIDGWIRSMVTFERGNLRKDTFPNHSLELYDMDLILCRNVFIYFEREAISEVIKKFTSTLKNDGYLFTGHSELFDQELGSLRTRFFPESIIYQRDDNVPLEKWKSAIKPKPPLPSIQLPPLQPIFKPEPEPKKRATLPVFSPPSAAPKPKISKAITTSTKNPLIEAEDAFNDGTYGVVIEKAEQAIAINPQSFDAYYLMAQAYANLGDHDDAAECCRQALKINLYAVEPHYLLAHIAEERGNVDEAKSYLKKIIYTSPSFVAAYLDLASLYESEGDNSRARKMRSTALQLLKVASPNSIIKPYNIKASALLKSVQEMINKF